MSKIPSRKILAGKKTASFLLTAAMLLSMLSSLFPRSVGATGIPTELTKLVYTAANAAAEYDNDRSKNDPAKSYFPATSGVFQSISKLTAWDNNTQVLIGYAGSNRTPVVFNNASTATATGWLAASTVGIDNASAFEIKFSTAAYENIRFSCTQKSTGSGPDTFKLAYRIGTTDNFTSIDASSMNPDRVSNDTYTALSQTYHEFVLPAEMEGEGEVYLRVYFDGTATLGKNGNTSINNIEIIGDKTGGPDTDVELMGLDYMTDNAAAVYNVPENSYFPATGGFFQSDSRLTAWDNNTQVLIGYTGSNRTPVVFNNGSLVPSSADWQAASVFGVENASAFEIKFKTTGFENIVFSCTQKSTGSGPDKFKLAYRLGSEGSFTPIEDSTVSPPRKSNDTYDGLEQTYDAFILPAEIADQEEVYLRVYFDGLTNLGKNGNTSINDIVITGSEFKPFTDAMISAISDQPFTGQPVKPALIVTDGTVLEEGVHYNVTYSNNDRVGTATATITGKSGGGYSGSASKTFNIISALPSSYGTMITHLGSYSAGMQSEDGGVAEIVAYNKDNQKMYLVNGINQTLDIVSLAGITAGTGNSYTNDVRVEIGAIGTANGFSAGDITSVAVNTRIKAIAISVQHGEYDEKGFIVFLDYDGNYITHFEAGVQPDMIGFTPDNNYVMTADEGEPRMGYGAEAVDPKGSVTMIDLRDVDNHYGLKNLADDKVTIIYFDDFDIPAKRAQLVDGLVLLKPDTAPSVDLEPEYIAFNENSETAYVSLQEANAVAALDIASKTFTSIKGLGFKDHSLPGNEIDLNNDKIINIRNENVFGVYMPDGLATVNIGGVQYVLTPNEGDSRSDWVDYDDLTTKTINGALDVECLINAERDVLKDRPDDTFILGGRSFSIWNASDMSQIYDSGSDFERITGEVFPAIFNAHHRANGMEARSNKKGPEPEDIKTLQIESKVYAFIGLERIGGLMMYEITDPSSPVFVDYFNHRDPAVNGLDAGDLGTEGLYVIKAEDSPTGYPMVLAANEVSGTVSVLQINEGAVSGAQKTVNILHTNDSHGRIYQVDGNNAGMMGIDKIAAIKNSTPGAILVDAGDTLHGLPIVNTNKGLNAIELMAAAGYSVMTPGNHDFNYGSARLSELAAIASGYDLDIISSNVYNNTETNFLSDTKIVTINGVKVGFFGLTTQETPILTGPVNVASLEFKAYKQSADNAITKLRSDGAQIIAALTHVGIAEIKDLIPELAVKPDVIIHGHDHVLGSETVDGVLITGAGQYQENLGKVSVTVNADGEVISKTATHITKADTENIAGTPSVKALADAKKATVEAEFNVIVAKSDVLLSSTRGTDDGTTLGVRNSEQSLGNLVADAMRITGEADIAITNGGGLRADIKAGDITKGDINAVLPFGNVLVVKEATPKAIKDIMEIGLSSLPATHGRFPQISGMNIVYDPFKPVGERVVSISIGGFSLDLNDNTTTYKIATNDFMASGGDGYDTMGSLATIAELDSLDTMLEQYIIALPNSTITANNAKIEDRIITADQAAANAVIAKIDLIPTTITLADKSKVTETRTAFDALTAEQKVLVSNIANLTAAESAIAALEAQAATDVTNPTDPSDPSNPTEPTEPTEPTDPSIPNPTDPKNSFSDMPRDVNPGDPGHHWALNYIYELADKGILTGYEDGSFKPEKFITRAEYVQILTKAFEIYDPNAKSYFKDVADGSWYEAAVASATNTGLTNGTSETTFDPDRDVRREEMMTVVGRALVNLRGYEFPAEDKIEDLLKKFADKDDISDFEDCVESIALNVELGLVEGSEQPDDSWMLFPKANIKRCEVAKIVAKLLKVEAK